MRSTLAALMRKEPQKNSGCLPLHPFRPHGSSKAAGAGPPAPGPARTTPSRSSRRRQSRWFSRRARAAAGPHARDNLKSHPVLFQDHTRRRFLLHGRRRSSRFISLYRFSSLLQVARLHRPPQRPQQRRRRLPRRRHRHSDRNQGCGNPPLTLKKKTKDVASTDVLARQLRRDLRDKRAHHRAHHPQVPRLRLLRFAEGAAKQRVQPGRLQQHVAGRRAVREVRALALGEAPTGGLPSHNTFPTAAVGKADRRQSASSPTAFAVDDTRTDSGRAGYRPPMQLTPHSATVSVTYARWPLRVKPTTPTTGSPPRPGRIPSIPISGTLRCSSPPSPATREQRKDFVGTSGIGEIRPDLPNGLHA